MSKMDFQPMPKRFMVWVKSLNRFIHNGIAPCVFENIYELIDFINNYQRSYEDLLIVQSTNLFDEDDKEIFEGSIVPWNEDMGVVKHRNGKWVVHITTAAFSVYHEVAPNADMVKVIGHILSNPELLEGHNG